uniref:Conserved oligomeric Golgi complex subunit 4 n=1 Tax=Macrostomum lignano TaxID=282301 RepID=A0A1I8FRG5_9PLAT
PAGPKLKRIGATTRRLDSVSNSSVAIGNGSNSSSAGLEPVLADARSLSEMIRCTSELADRVSSKVRQLDCAKSRVTAGLQPGLEKLGGYLGGCLREQCEKARIAASSAAGQDGGAWAAQQLLQLYEAVAASVEVHQPLVETFYGPGHLFGLLQSQQQYGPGSQAQMNVPAAAATETGWNEYCFIRRAASCAEMLAKAVALDSGVGGSDPTDTRLADDAFFILKKCLRRAVSTGSADADATCAALNGGQQTTPSGSKASVEEARQAACRGNLRDLRRLLESDTLAGWGGGTREAAECCLQAMDAGLGEALAAIGERGCRVSEQRSRCRPQVKQILAPLSNVSHVITEEELLAYEASDPGWRRPAFALANWLTDSSGLLLPPLFDTLLQSLAGELQRCSRRANAGAFASTGNYGRWSGALAGIGRACGMAMAEAGVAAPASVASSSTAAAACASRMRRHFLPPTCAGLHLLIAMCLLAPLPALEAQSCAAATRRRQ